MKTMNATEVIKEGVEKLKPKHHQFRSTAAAWRSKYKRHIGEKQIRKQLREEFSKFSVRGLLDFNNNLPTFGEKMPARLYTIYNEECCRMLNIFGITCSSSELNETCSPTEPV